MIKNITTTLIRGIRNVYDTATDTATIIFQRSLCGEVQSRIMPTIGIKQSIRMINSQL